jgi:hypothetical protein
MTDLDTTLSQLGSQADLFLMAARGPSTVSTVLPLTENLLKKATEAVEALRDTDPSARVEVERVGLSDRLRYMVTARHDMDEVEAPDDIGDLMPWTPTDDEEMLHDLAAIGIIADDRDLAILVTTRAEVEEAHGKAVDDETWAKVREALWADNQLATTLASQLIDKMGDSR